MSNVHMAEVLSTGQKNIIPTFSEPWKRGDLIQTTRAGAHAG